MKGFNMLMLVVALSLILCNSFFAVSAFCDFRRSGLFLILTIILSNIINLLWLFTYREYSCLQIYYINISIGGIMAIEAFLLPMIFLPEQLSFFQKIGIAIVFLGTALFLLFPKSALDT